MALSCPRCTRPIPVPDGSAGPPLFCMYCGQKLRATDETVVHVAQPSPLNALLSFDPDPPPDDAPPEAAPDHALTRSLANDPTEPDPAAAKDAAPSHVGGFRLVRYIGSGGMGNVYEAESPETGERVAVKLLSRRLSTNPASVERFRQEGRLASQISHPRCVFVLRADADNGRPFIVMELMPGKTLKDVVDERGPLPVDEAIRRTLDVIDGLIEAHRLGVIHRDVKPSNCFLTDDDRVKVGDFGLSKSLAGSAPDKQLTHSGTFLGTVLFAPPEQIRHEPVGYDSDVYAVSATLYYLLLGKAPHQHESLTAVLAKAISEPAPPLRPHRPDVPAELERLILRGLERDRTRRFQSLEELRDGLLDQLPALQQPALPRVMGLAYLIDCALLLLPIIGAELLAQYLAVGEHFHVSLVGLAVTVLYFTLAEGLFGATVGKRALRLRVVRLGRAGPPGLWPAAVRTVVYNAVWWAMLNTGDALARVTGPMAAGLFALIGFLVGLALLLFQLRRTEHGYRGVQDFAAGTRVVRRTVPGRRPRLVSKFPNPLDRHMPPAVPLPEAVGGFVVSGKACEIDDGGEVWAAEDRSLGRRVIVRVEPPGAGDDSLFDEPVVRPSRLRAVGHGVIQWGGGERAWVAYVAPAGSPLPDVVAPAAPLNWACGRAVLEQLVGELVDGRADGTAPRVLTAEQVWVEPGGRAQLLDFPLPTGRAVAAGETKSRYPGGASDPVTFVKQMAALVFEGAVRNGAEPVRAPLPPRAARIVNRLFADRYRDLADLRADLRESHAHPAEVSTGMRAGHLTLQAMLLSLGLLVMLTAGGLLAFTEAANVVQGAEIPRVVVGWIATPQGRADLLAAARAKYPPDTPQLALLEEALADDAVAGTIKSLERHSDERERERERVRGWLNRPEVAALDWVERAVDDIGDAPVSPDVKLAIAVGQLRVSRYPRERAAHPTPMRPRFLVHVVMLAAWPLAVWPLFAVLFRGGLAYWFAGITPVRGDGRRAGRLWCGLRELVVWLPLTAVLFAALFVQYEFPERVMVRTFLWLFGVLMLPLMAVVALRTPDRGPHDRLLDTHLVPV